MADKPLKSDQILWFGADPELFIESDGKVVGSEHVIPETGFTGDAITRSSIQGQHINHADPSINIVRDGVQVELNLPATKCRQWLNLELHHAFRLLKKNLEGQKFQVSFRQVVEVDKVELEKLSKASRRLGCQPSFNWYSPIATIGVNPDTYTKRSAGGHLHFGLPSHLMQHRERLAPLADVIIGNTSVLLDRDQNAAERRKVYGRAGEFRLPKHGFEYRTLSNYWLRSRELVSLVTGLMRMTMFVLDTSVSSAEVGGWAADQALLDLISLPHIEKAINTNDVELARANFEGVKEFIKRHVPEVSYQTRKETGLSAGNVDLFTKLVNRIDTETLEGVFPEAPMTHWTASNFAWGRGIELFFDPNNQNFPL